MRFCEDGSLKLHDFEEDETKEYDSGLVYIPVIGGVYPEIYEMIDLVEEADDKKPKVLHINTDTGEYRTKYPDS